VTLLLDTHTLLWWLAGEPMTEEVEDRLADPDTLAVVSAASVWEIAIKRQLGKLDFDGSIAYEADDGDFEPLSITPEHAERAGQLPDHHRDPFDRLLIAQAQVEGLTIVTRDVRFEAYDVELLRC
jgi:PIN domain nuclease of toxin-antitoxin system